MSPQLDRLKVGERPEESVVQEAVVTNHFFPIVLACAGEKGPSAVMGDECPDVLFIIRSITWFMVHTNAA